MHCPFPKWLVTALHKSNYSSDANDHSTNSPSGSSQPELTCFVPYIHVICSSQTKLPSLVQHVRKLKWGKESIMHYPSWGESIITGEETDSSYLFSSSKHVLQVIFPSFPGHEVIFIIVRRQFRELTYRFSFLQLICKISLSLQYPSTDCFLGPFKLIKFNAEFSRAYSHPRKRQPLRQIPPLLPLYLHAPLQSPHHLIGRCWPFPSQTLA